MWGERAGPGCSWTHRGTRMPAALPPFSLCTNGCALGVPQVFVSHPISHLCWEMRIFTPCSPPLSRTARQDLSWAAPWGTCARSAVSGWREAWQSTRSCSSVGDQRCWRSLMVESATFPTKESHWNVMIWRFLSQHCHPHSQNILRLTEPMSRWSCFRF